MGSICGIGMLCLVLLVTLYFLYLIWRNPERLRQQELQNIDYKKANSPVPLLFPDARREWVKSDGWISFARFSTIVLALAECSILIYLVISTLN